MKVLVLFIAVFLTLLMPLEVFASSDEQAQAAAREQRIQSYTATYPVKLSEKEQAEISTVCVSAQDKLQKVSQRTALVAEERHTTYEVIDARLNAVQQRLFRQQITVSAVDNLLKSYRDHTASFKSSLVVYQQALGDAAAMDCKTSPAAFRSAIEAVRVARKSVSDDSAAITQTINTETKSAFSAIKKRLTGAEK